MTTPGPRVKSIQIQKYKKDRKRTEKKVEQFYKNRLNVETIPMTHKKGQMSKNCV